MMGAGSDVLVYTDAVDDFVGKSFRSDWQETSPGLLLGRCSRWDCFVWTEQDALANGDLQMLRWFLRWNRRVRFLAVTAVMRMMLLTY
jgi:hypothetical protein